MDENNNISNVIKDANKNLEAKDQKAEEQKQHWAYKLFIEHPELFLPALERGKEKAVREVEGLCKIFDEYKLPKDSKILDLSCGIGRHSIPLAKRGYKVVGYDISPLYLQKAREWAKREELINNNNNRGDDESKSNSFTIKFYQGDLKDAAKILSGNGQTDFDAIISMETSIGYFGEEADYQMFKDLASICSSSYSAKSSYSSSSPIFVIDTINRDYLIREFQPYIADLSQEKLEVHIKRKFDFESSSMEEEWKFYDKRRSKGKKISAADDDAVYLKQILDLNLNFRVYSLHELIRLLKQAGWNCISKYGDIVTLEPFNRSSRNMVLVSQMWI
ncbi:MAG TPA: methyltransferase domain-containing protein [Nitrososphaeraceae archaeon]|nr:methyltransferase domain-containing protein [Nitrososphaeraceae archaeon]